MRTPTEALKEIRDRLTYFCLRTDGKYDPPWATELVGIIDETVTDSHAVGNTAAHAMTLDEAIAHAEDVADRCDTSCGREHRQLADWLKELRDVKNQPIGNAAAMHEALGDIVGIAKIALTTNSFGNSNNSELWRIIDKCNSVLSARARNCDAFNDAAEIERGYDGRPSIFDSIGRGDLIMAFFPCIMFCGISQMNMTLECYRKNHGTIVGAGNYIISRSQKRQRFLELLMKFCFTCIDRGLRMIFENPYSANTYLKNGFIKPPDIVDNDRTKRGDFFSKCTGYWFFNCEPKRGITIDRTPKEKVRHILMHTHQYRKHDRKTVAVHKAETGICDEGRSMTSPDYARNFIADFILGRPLGGRPQQQDLFATTDFAPGGATASASTTGSESPDRDGAGAVNY